jgi:hypothetical protein
VGPTTQGIHVWHAHAALHDACASVCVCWGWGGCQRRPLLCSLVAWGAGCMCITTYLYHNISVLPCVAGASVIASGQLVAMPGSMQAVLS